MMRLDKRYLRAYRLGSFSRLIGISYHQEVAGNELYAAVSVHMEKVEENSALVPLLELNTTMAQELMDDLWQCGVRPSEGSGSAGQLAAVQRHLEDMRALVWKGPKP